MRRAALLLLASAFCGAPRAATAEIASFDCAAATAPAEIAVCRTPALGAKDIRMATLYEVLQTTPPAVSGMAYREFRDNQHDLQASWIKLRRNACGADLACLSTAYDERIGELNNAIGKSLGLTYGRMCDGELTPSSPPAGQPPRASPPPQ